MSKNGGSANVLRFVQSRADRPVWVSELEDAFGYTRDQALRYVAYLRRNNIDGAGSKLQVLVHAHKFCWVNGAPVPVTITQPTLPVVSEPEPDPRLGLRLEVFRIDRAGQLLAEATDGQLYRVTALGIPA